MAERRQGLSGRRRAGSERGRDTFRRQPHSRARGAVGEGEAESWLCGQGYRVVARNVVNAGGEIDLVAWDGEVLCFVEVKARASSAYGPAIAAVSPAKQRRVARAAAHYLARQPVDAPCRFDVLGLDLAPDGWRFTLVRDAFSDPIG